MLNVQNRSIITSFLPQFFSRFVPVRTSPLLKSLHLYLGPPYDDVGPRRDLLTPSFVRVGVHRTCGKIYLSFGENFVAAHLALPNDSIARIVVNRGELVASETHDRNIPLA